MAVRVNGMHIYAPYVSLELMLVNNQANLQMKYGLNELPSALSTLIEPRTLRRVSHRAALVEEQFGLGFIM